MSIRESNNNDRYLYRKTGIGGAERVGESEKINKLTS
jgi:hypothetical protein